MKSRTAWALLLSLVLGPIACDPEPTDDEARAGVAPDARLTTHRVESGNPTAAGLAYLEAVARAHEEADRAGDPEDRAAALRRGLALPVPAGLNEAEVLRLELTTRLCETLGEREGGVALALDILQPMLAPDRSLPLDRASARALVTLGDLAVDAGDDALAMGSYMRAIRVMSSMRREIDR
ncbi:MAG TPA: hypothetical protein VG755_08820, partial [Nannocystaceae bacterium]|nr:hypothetical protein [Nannocystaceae bacterium]